MLCFAVYLDDLQRPAIEKHCLDSHMTPVYADFLALDFAHGVESLRWLRSRRIVVIGAWLLYSFLECHESRSSLSGLWLDRLSVSELRELLEAVCITITA